MKVVCLVQYGKKIYQMYLVPLTLKGPNKICSRHSKFSFFIFWRRHFMWIVCLADDSHEISRLVFSVKQKERKKKKKIVVCCCCDWRFKVKTDSVGRPRWLSWMCRPTGDREVAGSTLVEVGNILSLRLNMKYFLRSFSPFCWFKKGSCQFLAKGCAQNWLTT